MENTLTDIPLQQKPFDVLVATHRIKRPAQGLVPANALHMGAQVSPFRVVAMKQLACRGIRFKQGQILLANIRIVCNISAEFPFGVIKGRFCLCKRIRVGQRGFVHFAPLHYKPCCKVQKAVIRAATVNQDGGSKQFVCMCQIHVGVLQVLPGGQFQGW